MKKTTTPGFRRGITSPKGFRAAAGAFGIKPSGLPDLALIVADRPSVAAGVFTKNRMVSPSVIVGRRHVRSGIAQAIVCNSGISNAGTGHQGLLDASDMCRLVAAHNPSTRSQPSLVLPASTGVIGKRLPMDQIRLGIEQLIPQLNRGAAPNEDAARAILTTDLVPKSAYRSVKAGASRLAVSLGGIAKGSGMIAPNMATMLAFVTTDVSISASMLRRALRQAVGLTFNKTSVDQHTSPSDTVYVLASGLAGNRTIRTPGRGYDQFFHALTDLCGDLAYQIVTDGEGATRVIRVCVCGAKSQRDAERAAKAIVDSPLVKTAIHGADPNWGRITTAVGYSGASVRPEAVCLWISAGSGSWRLPAYASRRGICVFDHGEPVGLSAQDTKKLQGHMKASEVAIHVDLGAGKFESQWLGCDLSRDYVRINADYTT